MKFKTSFSASNTYTE